MTMWDTVHADCSTHDDRIRWAEEAISAAQARHPDQHSTLDAAFYLLIPTHPGMCSGPLYRAHCREILERVSAGADTRPGTAVEVLITLPTAPTLPLPTTTVALFLRMWKAAELPEIEPPAPLPDYEATPYQQLHIDVMEKQVRDQLTQDQRPGPEPTRPTD
ncbi:hypothetical protein [Nocardia sp. NBC_01327]|uniref:hypothetical protein n=1 Tax=Nocardia sp. NBC_01327 TaxID=2903593 RepID=UPI002E10AD0B|nr:hypothetical protein OG326_42430 [Nocardia sp. NBC_01327]